jgi:hypothetical protein
MAGVATPAFWLATPLSARFHVHTTLRLPNGRTYVADDSSRFAHGVHPTT